MISHFFTAPFPTLSPLFISPHKQPSQKRLFCYIYMHRTLADPEFLCRLPYRGIMVYDIVCYGNYPFLYIFLHGTTPENVFYIILGGRLIYAFQIFSQKTRRQLAQNCVHWRCKRQAKNFSIIPIAILLNA